MRLADISRQPLYTLTPSQFESCMALSMFLLRALVTNTTGTCTSLSLLTSFLNALRAASSTSVPRASTPSISKQIPNFGFMQPQQQRSHDIVVLFIYCKQILYTLPSYFVNCNVISSFKLTDKNLLNFS